MHIDALIRRIRRYAAAQDWTKGQLAVAAGMSDTVLRNFDRPDWNPTTSTLRRLEGIIPPEFEPDASSRFADEAA